MVKMSFHLQNDSAPPEVCIYYASNNSFVFSISEKYQLPPLYTF